MKNKIITFVFIIYLFTFAILGIALPDKEISASERRKLTKFPSFEVSSDYITKVEKYLLDHFAFRDSFRSIKAMYNFNIMQKLDNNGIFLKDNYIFKSNYPTNYKSIKYFYSTLSNLSANFTENNNVYIALIPDKNYYLEDKNFLNIDYNYIFNEAQKFDATFIDLRDCLTLKDFYETDTHWRQEKLDTVLNKLVTEMGHTYKHDSYTSKTYDKFYGVYYGESAIRRKPEKLTYLTSEAIENATVKYLENSSSSSVYSENKLSGLDAYDVYLDGASSFIEITNNLSTSKKELVIFRDSFGSSLSPLLISYYQKITIIDNRYINSQNFNKLIDFKDQDILFLYSTLVANDSYSLKG